MDKSDDSQRWQITQFIEEWEGDLNYTANWRPGRSPNDSGLPTRLEAAMTYATFTLRRAGSSEEDSVEVGPLKVASLKVASLEVRSSEEGTLGVGPSEVDPLEVSPWEADPLKVGSSEEKTDDRMRLTWVGNASYDSVVYLYMGPDGTKKGEEVSGGEGAATLEILPDNMYRIVVTPYLRPITIRDRSGERQILTARTGPYVVADDGQAPFSSTSFPFTLPPLSWAGGNKIAGLGTRKYQTTDPPGLEASSWTLTAKLPILAGETTASYFNLRDGPNTGSKILGELNGTSVRVKVTDKAQNSSGRWLQVTLEADVMADKVVKLPTGTQAWAIAWQTSGGPAVVAFADFDKQFLESLIKFEDEHKDLRLNARITRLRQMSHESNLPFDHVIGTAKGPEYLDTRPFIKDIWQLLMDYQIVAMPDGRHVDVYHLLVGLDVLTKRMAVSDPILKMPLGANRSAATWAGDIGAAVADATVGTDKAWHDKNKNASPKQYIDHYFGTRASEADLLGTIDAWDINGERSESTGSLTDLLRSYYEDTRPGAKRMLTTRRETAISTFLLDYGFKYDYTKHSYPYTLINQQPATRNIREAIRLFSRVWIKGKSPFRDPEPDWTVLREMTGKFLAWLEFQAIENGVETE
jgi:hypothetical protein